MRVWLTRGFKSGEAVEGEHEALEDLPNPEEGKGVLNQPQRWQEQFILLNSNSRRLLAKAS